MSIATSRSTSVWIVTQDPMTVGFVAAVGERCIYLGVIYTKKDTGDTDWILGTDAYGGGGSDGNVDGGTPTSIYGGSIAIDGGGP